MKRIIIVMISVLAVMFVLNGCGNKTEVDAIQKADANEMDDVKVKIGLMVPLSGDAAPYGESVKKAVELAVKELSLEEKVELVVEDSKCEGKEAVTVINKLISIDKVDAVIGELCSGATIPAAAVANEQKVVMVSPASTSPKLSEEGGDYFFRVIPSDSLQGDFGAKLVYEKGARKLAVLYGNEDYGVGFNSVLMESFPALGGDVVASEAFEPKSTDLRTQLTKIKAAEPDAIYIISNSPDSAAAALKQIDELGLGEVIVVGSEGLKADEILQAAGEASNGLVVTSVSAGSDAFKTAHENEYSEVPGPFAAQAYDAVKALSLVLGSDDMKTALYNVDFEGASGHIAFDQNGDVSGNYEVYIVKNQEFAAEE